MHSTRWWISREVGGRIINHLKNKKKQALVHGEGIFSKGVKDWSTV